MYIFENTKTNCVYLLNSIHQNFESVPSDYIDPIYGTKLTWYFGGLHICHMFVFINITSHIATIEFKNKDIMRHPTTNIYNEIKDYHLKI